MMSSSTYSSQGQVCKASSTGTSTYGMKSRFPCHVTAKASESASATATATVTAAAAAPASSPPGMKKSTIKFKQEDRSAAVDWSPVDDGIEIRIPSPSEEPAARETVDSYIHGVLYGPSRRRRLPVFTETCPE